MQGCVDYKRVMFSWYRHGGEVPNPEVNNPFVGTIVGKSDDCIIWEQTWPDATCAFMADHRIEHSPLVAGAVFLQIGRHAVAKTASNANGAALCDVAFEAMLFLDNPQQQQLEVRVTTSTQVTMHLAIEALDTQGGWIQYSSMGVQSSGIDILDKRKQPQEMDSIAAMDGVAFYASTGNDYRGEYRSVSTVYMDQDQVITNVSFQVDMEEPTVRCTSHIYV